MNNKKIFILFDEDFWKNYINLFDDVNKLIIVNKTIKQCLKLDNNLKNNELNLIYKIHKSGLDSINNGTLKNEKVIDFIINDDYFSYNKYASKYYRPLDIVKGLDFDEMTDNFFNAWQNSNILLIQ